MGQSATTDRYRLDPPADLYDGVYSDSLKGRWRSRSLVGSFYIVVEGPGSRDGTVAAHAEDRPENRQEDLPITTLHMNYEGLR